LGLILFILGDFSVKSYSFDETADDFELEDFDTGVHHDVESGMVDMALRAVSTLRQAWSDGADDGEMFLYASPWSPPAWMKTPTYHWEQKKTFASMTGSALPNCLKDGVGPDSEYAKAWALYFSKFLTAYKNLGLSLSAVTVQNEPEFAAPWEACAYDPDTQHDFVTYHLGPRLRQDHPDVKILAFDHNKDHINQWANTLLNESSQAKPYISGTAYHWYAGGM
jgi:glucosylceramidase